MAMMMVAVAEVVLPMISMLLVVVSCHARANDISIDGDPAKVCSYDKTMECCKARRPTV